MTEFPFLDALILSYYKNILFKLLHFDGLKTC